MSTIYQWHRRSCIVYSVLLFVLNIQNDGVIEPLKWSIVKLVSKSVFIDSENKTNKKIRFFSVSIG